MASYSQRAQRPHYTRAPTHSQNVETRLADRWSDALCSVWWRKLIEAFLLHVRRASFDLGDYGIHFISATRGLVADGWRWESRTEGIVLPRTTQSYANVCMRVRLHTAVCLWALGRFHAPISNETHISWHTKTHFWAFYQPGSPNQIINGTWSKVVSKALHSSVLRHATERCVSLTVPLFVLKEHTPRSTGWTWRVWTIEFLESTKFPFNLCMKKNVP